MTNMETSSNVLHRTNRVFPNHLIKDCLSQLSVNYWFKMCLISKTFYSEFLKAFPTDPTMSIARGFALAKTSDLPSGSLSPSLICSIKESALEQINKPNLDRLQDEPQSVIVVASVLQGRAWLCLCRYTRYNQLAKKMRFFIVPTSVLLASTELQLDIATGKYYYVQRCLHTLHIHSSTLSFHLPHSKFSFHCFHDSLVCEEGNLNLFDTIRAAKARVNFLRDIRVGDYVEYVDESLNSSKATVVLVVPDQEALKKLPWWYIPFRFKKHSTIVLSQPHSSFSKYQQIPIEHVKNIVKRTKRIPSQMVGRDFIQPGMYIVPYVSDFPVFQVTATYEKHYACCQVETQSLEKPTLSENLTLSEIPIVSAKSTPSVVPTLSTKSTLSVVPTLSVKPTKPKTTSTKAKYKHTNKEDELSDLSDIYYPLSKIDTIPLVCPHGPVEYDVTASDSERESCWLYFSYGEPLVQCFDTQKAAMAWSNSRNRIRQTHFSHVRPGDVILRSYVNPLLGVWVAQTWNRVLQIRQTKKTCQDNPLQMEDCFTHMTTNGLDLITASETDESIAPTTCTDSQRLSSQIKDFPIQRDSSGSLSSSNDDPMVRYFYISPTNFIREEQIQGKSSLARVFLTVYLSFLPRCTVLHRL